MKTDRSSNRMLGMRAEAKADLGGPAVKPKPSMPSLSVNPSSVNKEVAAARSKAGSKGGEQGV
jgi:hypothetical protein